MAFWDDWQKNKNPITWSEGFQHGYKKIPKSSTPSSEELSLAKANKKLVGKEKLDKNMQDTVQKVVKNMIKEGNTSGRFDKNKPRDLDKFNQKFIDKPSNKTSLNDVSSTADSNSYTITSRIKRPFSGREYAHKTIHNDGSVTISYGPTPNPKDATDFIGKRSATKPESKPEPKIKPEKPPFKPKPTVGSVTKVAIDDTNTIDSEVFFRMLEEASDMDEFHRMIDEYDAKRVSESAEKAKLESKVKPTIDSAVKEAAKPADGSEAFIKGVARSAKKISNGKDIDPTAEGSLRRMVSKDLPNETPRVDGKGVSKPDERAKAFTESFNKEMSEKHFNETSAEPTSNSIVKNSVGNKLKNSKVGNWLKNTGNWLKNSKVGGYFTDSPLTPRNVALTYKGWTGQANPVAYAANAYGMGSGGGYMPVGEHTVDQLRIQHGQDDVSSLDTVVPMNPQGTMYLDPKLGFQPTEVLEDYEGNRFYRNAQTGQFEPLDYNPRYSTYVPLPRVKKVYPTDSNGVPYLNDILGGVLSMPKSTTPLPIPPMVPPVSADEGEIPSGTVEVGPDKEVPAQPVQSVQPAQPMAKSLRRAPKPKLYVEPVVSTNKPPVVNNTSVQTPTSIPVAAPTLSSVASQAVRHNGGFDNYRRESVLSALRAAGGISPAEAVQRGIIPWEALNYV